MSVNLLMTGNVFALQSTELILIIVSSLVAGYIFSRWFHLYKKRSTDEDADPLETEMEILQSKFNAEIIRKEEEARLLQDEIKAAEKKNFELQLQYAKALNHIDKLKAHSNVGEPVADGIDVREAENQVMLNLQEKITKQEQNLVQMEQKLEQENQKKTELEASYQQLTAEIAGYKELVEKLKHDHETVVQHLQEQLSTKESKEKEYNELVEKYKLESEQLNASIKNADQPDELQQEILRLKSRLEQKETVEQAAAEISANKEGITGVRVQAEQVAGVIDTFRDKLTALLRDAYSYEQLLASNERLNQNISQLHLEKQAAEEQLKELQLLKEEKERLEGTINQKINEAAHLQEQLRIAEAEQFSKTKELQDEVVQQQQLLAELEQTKNNLQVTVHELTKKLDEKERISREMIHAVKDIESRFAGMYAVQENEPELSGNNGMQLG